MAITVPDDSYVSVADADTFWSARNNSDWSSASTADKEKALRFATEYIDGKYAGRWIGEHPGSNSQIRAWPRNNAYDMEGRVWTGIPQMLKDATARLALDLLSAFPEEAESRGGGVKREQVGPLEVEYFDSAPAGTTYPYLDTLLYALVKRRRLKRV